MYLGLGENLLAQVLRGLGIRRTQDINATRVSKLGKKYWQNRQYLVQIIKTRYLKNINRLGVKTKNKNKNFSNKEASLVHRRLLNEGVGCGKWQAN